MSNDPERSDASQISRDRESIRAWAEEEGATPYRHREEEAYRLADEDRAGESHERADWDEFHSHLEEDDRVVIYHGEADEQPLEVTPRDDAISRSNVSNEDLEERLVEGETVTSTVTETAVVEEVVVEEATIESELVDTEITDDRVVDAELLSRECTNCTLEERGTMDADAWFDADRYLSSVGDPGESPWGESMGTDVRTDPDDASVTTGEPSTTESITTEQRTDDPGSGTPVTDPIESESAGTGTSDAGPMDDEMTGTDEPMMETDDEMTRTDDDMAGQRDDVMTGQRDDEMTETGGGTTGATADRTYTDVDEEYPYTAHLDVEEAWSVTREFTERYTVESRVADVDVAEADSIEERDIDIEGLQHNLVESGLVDFDLSPEELLAESEVETEFTEDDRIETHFTRSQVVEEEVVDRRELRAEVTGAAELADFERISSMDLSSETTPGAAATSDATVDAGPMDETADEPTDAMGEESMGAGSTDARTDETATGSATASDTGSIPLSQDEVGKEVFDSAEETIGMVTEVSDDGTTMYVDPHPGITDRIKAALDWGGADDDDYPVEVEQIDNVTEDAVQLKGAEEIEEISSPTP